MNVERRQNCLLTLPVYKAGDARATSAAPCCVSARGARPAPLEGGAPEEAPFYATATLPGALLARGWGNGNGRDIGPLRATGPFILPLESRGFLAHSL